MNASYSVIERFNINRHKLTTVLDGLQGNFEALGLKSVVPLLQTLKQRLETERLKVLIVGQFKQGKSTVINALLGEEVLPAFAVPCTAVINEIKYGETKRAVVHFRDPVPTPLPEHLSSEARQHIENHRGKKVPAMAVPIDELERYVVIPDPAKDQGESVAESPFRLVEIYWPIELCRNGVEIIDSPGLNEHGTRTQVTVDYLSRVDAVAFVLSCIALAGEAEIAFIENNLRTSGHEDIFFACNRFDQVRDRERQRVIKFGREKLARLTTFGSDGVFFVSALDALEGRLCNQAEKMERSGFLPFERRLSTFLMESRGRLKLLHPARQLVTEVNKALNEAIPQQQRMLQASVAELEKRWEEVRPRAEQTKNRCRQVLDRVERERERLRMDIRDKLETFVRQMADEVCNWVAGYQPKNTIKEALVKEVSEFVDAKVDRSLAKWQQETLTPYVQKRLEDLGEGLRESLDGISLSILDIKQELTGQPTDEALTADKYRAVLSFAPSVAVGFVGALLGLTNPLLLGALVFGSGTIQGLFKAGARSEKVKNACGKKIAAHLKGKASASAEYGAKVFYDKIGEIQTRIKADLQQELQSVVDLRNAVLRDKRQGDAQVQQRLATLNTIACELQQAQLALNDIVFDLAR